MNIYQKEEDLVREILGKVAVNKDVRKRTKWSTDERSNKTQK